MTTTLESSTFDLPDHYAFDDCASRTISHLVPVELLSTHPYAVVMRGTTVTDAGLGAGDMVDYASTIVFQGDEVHAGQVTAFQTDLLRFSDGKSTIHHIAGKLPLVGGVLQGLLP